MTQEEWLNTTGRAQWMVHTLGDFKLPRTKAGRRKLRLFACGCCRLAWARLRDDRLRDAVQAAERFADGLASKGELAAARATIEWMMEDGALPRRTPQYWPQVAVFMAVATTDPQAYSAAFSMTAISPVLAGQFGRGEAGEPILCSLVRCVFGNPFRPVTVDPAWLTSAVVQVASAAYLERLPPSGELDRARLAILADALEEAGCGDHQVLAHLRGPTPHMRGCFVVDLLAGRL